MYKVRIIWSNGDIQEFPVDNEKQGNYMIDAMQTAVGMQIKYACIIRKIDKRKTEV